MKKFAIVGITTGLLVTWLIVVSIMTDYFNDNPIQLPQIVVMAKDDSVQSGSDEFNEEVVMAGRLLFEETAGGIGCAACHAHFALGDSFIAPNVRGVSKNRIEGALEAVEEMEFLIDELSSEDIDAIAEYLRFLATLVPAKSVTRRGVFTPDILEVPANDQVQLIINNLNRSVCTLSSGDSIFQDTEIQGRTEADIIWTSPLDPGESFQVSCLEEPESILTISVIAPPPDDD
jgi:cytochrome c553